MDDAMRKFNIRDISNALSHAKFRRKPHPFFSAVKVYPARFVSGLHLHDFPQLWYCLEGSYQHCTVSGTHSCQKGSLILIPPGCPDSFRVPETSSVRLASIDLAPELFPELTAEQYLNTISNLFLPNYAQSLDYDFFDHVNLSKEGQQLAQTMLCSLCALSGSLENVSPEHILGQLEVLFSLPEFALPEHFRGKALSLIEDRVFPVLRALVYINRNFSHKITVEELTRVSALCQTNFFRHFKILTGASFSTYLLNLRVSQVTFLLGNTDYSFSYISGLCGFSDPAHMTNAFTRCTGRPPRVGRPKLQAYYTDKSETGEN